MLTFALYTHQGHNPTWTIHSLIHSPVALSQYHTKPIFHPHYHTHSHSLLHSNLALHSTTTKLMSRRNAIDPAVREAMSVSLCKSRWTRKQQRKVGIYHCSNHLSKSTIGALTCQYIIPQRPSIQQMRFRQYMQCPTYPI